MNWLRQVQVEGADGLDALYSASPDELAQIPTTQPAPTILDAINDLLRQVTPSTPSR